MAAATPRLVFDLDDTLYPERQFALSGFRACSHHAADHWGAEVDQLNAEMTELLDTGHLGGLFKLTMEKHCTSPSEDALAAFIDVYRRHSPEISLFEDASDALQHWAAHGPLGLITDGTHWVQQAKVNALGIAASFTKIVYTGALGGRRFHKPHPRSYELIEQALGGPNIEFVYVGDNPAKDFVTPNARGWRSVQIVRASGGIHDANAVADGGAPKHVISSLSELPTLLQTATDRL